MSILNEYDIIVVGGGHAGCEAAYAAARMGSKVLIVTMDLNRMAQMSCNPAVGGIAKGQIVREIDALGGKMGEITDLSTIQFRMLNLSKGPAMWSPRAQCDKIKFSAIWKNILEEENNIDFWQGTVIKLIFEDNRAVGVVTEIGVGFKSKCVILTSGTFLNGLMHFGSSKISGGRIVAKPYFFDFSGINTKESNYKWSVNGKTVSLSGAKNEILLRQDGKTGGAASVSLKIENQVRIFQFAENNFNITFGN
jgi:tRNA uridine 5-carboxymethylaminomethyl modification enzyme